MMRISFLRGGIDSLEKSLELLATNTDRDLRLAILLGFHGVSFLLKAAAVQQGLQVNRGNTIVPFPTVVGALKSQGWLRSSDNKALTLLNKLRNALEHEEAEFDRVEYTVAIHKVLPIVDRILRECGDTDLQDEISDESWSVLIEIEEFFKHREEALDEIVEQALDRPYGKDALVDPAESVFCYACGHDGLPWHGGERERVKCKFCGTVSLVATCNICNEPMEISEDDEWPYTHDKCWNDYINRND